MPTYLLIRNGRKTLFRSHHFLFKLPRLLNLRSMRLMTQNEVESLDFTILSNQSLIYLLYISHFIEICRKKHVSFPHGDSHVRYIIKFVYVLKGSIDHKDRNVMSA